jgi:hypothetical protein
MKRSVRRVGFGIAITMMFGVCARVLAAQAPAQPPVGAPGMQMMDPRRDTGQTVAPVFEGWEPNPDGTVSMYFGYMNRNWKEELDIPVGPNNSFDPAPADRGQPTHFLPRRAKQIFAVVVPKDFKQTITWTLTIRGNTERVPASLRPEQQIDVSKDTQNGNTPPKVQIPRSLDGTAGQPITLTANVTDDGLPKMRTDRRATSSVTDGKAGAETATPAALNVRWAKYRGPGTIKFSSQTTLVKDGVATTTAVFSAPGTYMVNVLADDGSVLLTSQGQNVPGFACCWTSTNVTVVVK